MYAIEALDFDEIDLVSGGNMGFFETIGWAYDNPGTALGQAADKFAGWYRVNSSEDPNYFIG